MRYKYLCLSHFQGLLKTIGSLGLLRVLALSTMYPRKYYAVCALAAGLIVPSLAVPAETRQPNSTNCRYLPADPQWPTEDDWSQLNKTIRGRLIKGAPLARQCHSPGLDNAACAKIQSDWVLTDT